MMRLDKVLAENRSKIIRKWSNALFTRSGTRYGNRPLRELRSLTSEATDANYCVLVNNDFSNIDAFIERITRLRLDSGFALSEVQKAFNLYRTFLVPILTETLPKKELTPALEKLNDCLSHTITRFSDYFQALHEKQVRDYAENLEQEVVKRTMELSESEASYRLLVEDINDGYFVNQNGRIIFANRAFCEMHGYTVDEALGRPYIDFVAPESLDKVQGYTERRLTHKDVPEQYTYLRLHKDGSPLPTENKVKLMLYQGEYASVGICRDITERVKMEQRIRESERLAHIGQLTTSLAHEIRNPLSSIKMSMQMLLRTMNFNGNNKRTMEISAKEIARLERILAEMLDFARPVKLKLIPASVNEIIESCIEILEPRVKEKSIVVKRRLDSHIVQAFLDRDKIEQVVINILLNAIEVLPAKGKIYILTKPGRAGQPDVRMEISDNGPGVSREDLPYLFDPFFSNKKKGTGLGLSNVNKIVEAHGGSVIAVPKARGLCVRVTLPVKQKHA
jgi:PAS domain S-box-containing protein